MKVYLPVIYLVCHAVGLGMVIVLVLGLVVLVSSSHHWLNLPQIHSDFS